RYDGGRFQAFGVGEGLPSSSIESLHQSPDGTIWAGTTQGLARFDGVRFERKIIVSERGDSVRLSAIASAPDGRLYVGLGGGLAIASSSAGSWKFQFIPAEPIRGIHVDSSGLVWMWCGNRICTLRQNGSLEAVSPILDPAGSRGGGTLTDKNGSVWA